MLHSVRLHTRDNVSRLWLMLNSRNVNATIREIIVTSLSIVPMFMITPEMKECSQVLISNFYVNISSGQVAGVWPERTPLGLEWDGIEATLYHPVADVL